MPKERHRSNVEDRRTLSKTNDKFFKQNKFNKKEKSKYEYLQTLQLILQTDQPRCR